MSDEDRIRWNRRYREGAYRERRYPNPYLEAHLEAVPRGRALDLACGSGRNSIYLAEQGFDVTGIDVSDVALTQAEQFAADAGVQVHWRQQNLLNHPELGGQTYELVVMFRFVAEALLLQLPALVAPGGYLMVEEHLRWPEERELTGPRSDRFRVAPGALQVVFEDTGLEPVVIEERLVTEPDGTTAAISRILGFRPKP